MTNLVILDGIGYIQTGDKLVSATPAEYVAEIERLRAQLPAEMQHCTIRFIECEKGHGRLVGTNWIDPGCLKCEVDRLSRSSAEPGARPVEPFVVKHYVSDERPSIKGNGFDGLEIGEDRQDAEDFVKWLNERLGVNR